MPLVHIKKNKIVLNVLQTSILYKYTVKLSDLIRISSSYNVSKKEHAHNNFKYNKTYTYKTLHILIGAQTIFFLCSLSFLLRLANIQYFLFGKPHVQHSSSELASLPLLGVRGETAFSKMVGGVSSPSSKANWVCKHLAKDEFIVIFMTLVR